LIKLEFFIIYLVEMPILILFTISPFPQLLLSLFFVDALEKIKKVRKKTLKFIETKLTENYDSAEEQKKIGLS